MGVARKLISLLAAGLLALGGLAACGDDDDDTGDTGADTEVDGGDTGDTEGDTGGDTDGGGEANADVEAYCDAVSEFVDNFDPADPDSATAGQELAEQGAELATSDLTAEDAERIGECTQQLTEISTGG
jgi:hypothetical protein